MAHGSFSRPMCSFYKLPTVSALPPIISVLGMAIQFSRVCHHLLQGTSIIGRGCQANRTSSLGLCSEISVHLPSAGSVSGIIVYSQLLIIFCSQLIGRGLTRRTRISCSEQPRSTRRVRHFHLPNHRSPFASKFTHRAQERQDRGYWETLFLAVS